MKNSVKYITIAGLLLSYSQIGFCDAMRDASKEGSNLGKSSVNQAKSTMTGFNPEKELQGFIRNPNETQYQKNDSGLSQAGNKELADSELGQSARDSFINNPKDKISWDSDLIQNALEIKDKADGIVSGTGENCVKQTQNESYFTNHLCEKEETIKQICTKKATVIFEEVETLELKNYTINGIEKIPDFRTQTIGNTVFFYYPMPFSGEITSATYQVSSNRIGGGSATITILGNSIKYKLKGNIPETKFNPSPNYFIEGKDLVITHPKNYGSWTGISKLPFIFKFKIEVKKKDYKPTISWINSCSVDKENAIKVKEWCSQNGEKRIFKKDGREFEVYSDCWEYSEEWVTNEGDDNTCTDYEKNPNCTVGERKCVLKIGNSCVRNEIKYQCQHTTKTEGYVCGDKFYCDDGSCVDTIGSENNGFNEAVSQLAAISQAGKEMSGLDESKMKAFSGKAMECRKAAMGYSNCCKSSGWGNDIGLAQCNSEEKAIGQAKAKKVIISIGTYCSKKVLGVCLQKKSSYCVFDNKLARIVQAQGRSGQLGIGFGSAKNPDCRGISINELQRLRFDYMDFSDFYEDLQNNLKIPEQDKLLDEVNRRMKEKFDEGKQQ